MNEQQLQQWLTTYIGQLSPTEQEQVTAEWNRLSPAQKNQVVTNAQGGPAEYVSQATTLIQGAAKGPTTAPTTKEPGVAPQTPAAPAAPPPQTATTENLSPAGVASTTSVGAGSTPVEGSNQATALINQYMTTPQWQGSPDDPQGAAAALGVDYASADQQYQGYLAHFQNAMNRATSLTQHAAAPMPETSFIQSLAQSAYGQWGPLIGMLAYEWQEQNGTALPTDLASGIVSRLKQLPANDAAQLQTQMLNSVEQISSAAKNADVAGGQATNLNLSITISSFLSQLGTYAPSIYGSSGSASGGAALTDASPGSYIGQYITAHPNTAGLEATQQGSERAGAVNFLSQYGMPTTDANIKALSNTVTLTDMGAYVSWMQGVGMPITPAILQTLMSMPFADPHTAQTPTGTGAAYLLDQVMPGTKMTYGAYQTVSGQLSSLPGGGSWESIFNTTPSKQQMAYFVGKSSADIQDYINNSMSSIPGITIGQKNDYENFISSLDQQSPQVAGITHVFSSQVDDSMMNQLHQQVVAQSTAKPTPGKM